MRAWFERLWSLVEQLLFFPPAPEPAPVPPSRGRR